MNWGQLTRVAVAGLFVSLASSAYAQAQTKRYVLAVSYKVGDKVLDDEFNVWISDQSIKFSCDSFDADKGPTVPRGGGTNAYSDSNSNGSRTCRITVRPNPDGSLFFDTLKTLVDKEPSKNTGKRETHTDAISFQMSFTGAACRLSSIRYVYADQSPYQIVSSSCK